MTPSFTGDSASRRRNGQPVRLLHQLAELLYKFFVALLLYGFFTPFALLLRLVRRDALRLRYDPHAESYWIDRRQPGPQPSSMSNLY